MIIDGRAIARDILRQARKEVRELPRTIMVRAVTMQPGRATESYLAMKARRAGSAGMMLEIIRLSDTATTEDVIDALAAPGADALLVQLPLPDVIDTDAVLNSIPLEKDADVLSRSAHHAFDEGSAEALLPPVVEAVKEILERSGVSPKGKQVVVVGNGWLVGEPCATWLSLTGARVTTITRESGDLSSLKEADIIVSGAGSPGLIQPHHLKPGVVLIDAGTSESGGAIVGDASSGCADIASVFTPVPGGVGPIAVACLFRNAAHIARRSGLQTP